MINLKENISFTDGQINKILTMALAKKYDVEIIGNLNFLSSIEKTLDIWKLYRLDTDILFNNEGKCCILIDATNFEGVLELVSSEYQDSILEAALVATSIAFVEIFKLEDYKEMLIVT